MEKIPKKLERITKELPFRVPMNYFDDFPARMQARIEIEGQPRKTKILNIIKPVLSLAAAFAAAFLLIYLPVKNINKFHEQASAEITQESNTAFFDIIERMDANTFFAILENENNDDPIDDDILIEYLAVNYNDYDIYLEMQK